MSSWISRAGVTGAALGGFSFFKMCLSLAPFRGPMPVCDQTLASFLSNWCDLDQLERCPRNAGVTSCPALWSAHVC